MGRLALRTVCCSRVLRAVRPSQSDLPPRQKPHRKYKEPEITHHLALLASTRFAMPIGLEHLDLEILVQFEESYHDQSHTDQQGRDYMSEWRQNLQHLYAAQDTPLGIVCGGGGHAKTSLVWRDFVSTACSSALTTKAAAVLFHASSLSVFTNAP